MNQLNRSDRDIYKVNTIIKMIKSNIGEIENSCNLSITKPTISVIDITQFINYMYELIHSNLTNDMLNDDKNIIVRIFNMFNVTKYTSESLLSLIMSSKIKNIYNIIYEFMTLELAYSYIILKNTYNKKTIKDKLIDFTLFNIAIKYNKIANLHSIRTSYIYNINEIRNNKSSDDDDIKLKKSKFDE